MYTDKLKSFLENIETKDYSSAKEVLIDVMESKVKDYIKSVEDKGEC